MPILCVFKCRWHVLCHSICVQLIINKYSFICLLRVCNCCLKVQDTIQSPVIGHLGCLPSFSVCHVPGLALGGGFLEVEMLIQRTCPF